MKSFDRWLEKYANCLKLSGLGTASDSDSELPSIVGLAAYRLAAKPKFGSPVREWLILNGMMAGRFTSFFGAPCIADSHDCVGILEARLESEDLTVVRVRVSLESL